MTSDSDIEAGRAVVQNEIENIKIQKYGRPALLEYHKRHIADNMEPCSKLEYVDIAENAKMSGIGVNLTAVGHALSLSGGEVVDVSSRNGIPDFVLITKGEMAEQECVQSLIDLPELREACSASPAARVSIPRTCRQPFTGTGNAREQKSVALAARRVGLTVSALVTKATLSMARFINRHYSRKGESACRPCEAYLFMEHGERMQDAFTPEEVQQALDMAGLTGSALALEFMEILVAAREARKNKGKRYLQEWGCFKKRLSSPVSE